MIQSNYYTVNKLSFIDELIKRIETEGLRYSKPGKAATPGPGWKKAVNRKKY